MITSILIYDVAEFKCCVYGWAFCIDESAKSYATTSKTRPRPNPAGTEILLVPMNTVTNTPDVTRG